jgi:REP element-mobilizing transposase RayT
LKDDDFLYWGLPTFPAESHSLDFVLRGGLGAVAELNPPLYLRPMPVKQTIPYNDGVYFITITCFKWMPLLELTKSYDLVYKWFDYLKSKGHYITGYVIMPNHLHALIAFQNGDKSINKIIGDGKRFIAYEIVKRLQQQNERNVLNELGQAVETADSRRGKKHEVWEDSFDWKECRTYAYLNQKLHYMHANPCTGKWNLAMSPVKYTYSSAGYYAGDGSGYPVTHLMQLDDVDLTKKLPPSPPLST